MIYELNELDSSYVAEAGGKGSSLGELIRVGVPVPAGFVVTSAAFEQFMSVADQCQHIHEIVQELDSGKIKAAVATEQIAALLAEAEVPKDVAAAVGRAAQTTRRGPRLGPFERHV